jgi:transposase InsO family protein
MVVDTLFLKRLYLFSVMDVTNRQIILFNITSNPTSEWLKTVVRSGFQCIADLPKVMVSDRDGIFGEWFGEFLKDYYEMELIRTPPRTPNCNSFIERWHRSFREEVLDHSLIFGTKDLRRLTTDYVSYYHHQRPHQGLEQNSPLKIHGGTSCNKTAKIKRSKVVDGLITNFERAA